MMGVAVAACLLLVTGVGALAAVVSGGKTLDVSSSVSSRVPGGWAVSDLSGQSETVLVPSGYENKNNKFEVGKESAVISYSDLMEEDCEPQPNEVENVADPSLSQVARGYDDSWLVNGNLVSGEGTVAGHVAKWTLGYGASAGTWFLPGKDPIPGTRKGIASEYPTYSAYVSLKVCVEDLGLATSYEMSSDLFEDSSENPEDEPTRKRNAFIAEAREEVHENLRQRYEANVEAMIEFLRSVDTTGWDGPTELNEVPTSLEGFDEVLEDPFQGKLKKPEASSVSSQLPRGGAQREKAENNESTTGENTKASDSKTLRLTIPKMEKVKKAIVPDTLGDARDSVKDLDRENAAEHLRGTGFPWQEEANVYIVGHRLGYPGYPSFMAFHDLDKLKEGDQIFVEDASGEQYTYEVFQTLEVESTDLFVTEPIEGKNILTLQTHTLPNYSKWLIVQAELVN